MFSEGKNKLHSCFCISFFVTKISFCKSPCYLASSDNVPVNSEVFLGCLWFPYLFFSTRLFGYFFQLLGFTLRNIVFISRLLYELTRNIWSSVCCDVELQCRVVKKIRCFQTLSKLIFLTQMNVKNNVSYENLSFRKLLRKTNKFWT